MKQPAVYILASRPNGTFYVGVTSNLPQRIWQHRNDAVEGFTRKYGVHLLVYFELHDDMTTAISREKQLTLATLSDGRRAIFYGAFGLLVLLIAGADKLFSSGGGTVLWIVLLVGSVLAIYRIWTEANTY